MTMKNDILKMMALSALLQPSFHAVPTAGDARSSSYIKSKMPNKKYAKRKKALRAQKKSKSINRK